MGLENATFISQLIATNPLSSDPRSQGDDHLRLIKQVLQNSFPGVNAEVTATAAELNSLVGVTGTLVSQLNDKASLQDLAGYSSLSQAQSYTRAKRYTPTDLGSVSGAITLNLSLGNTFRLTASGAITSIALTNGANGQPVWIKVLNPSAFAIAFGSAFEAANGLPPNLALQGTHLIHGYFSDSRLTILHVAQQIEAI